MKQLHCTVRVGNQRGIHGRIATRLAEIARDHEVALSISRNMESADCASILDVLALALVQGTEVILVAEGLRGEAALRAASDLLTAPEDP